MNETVEEFAKEKLENALKVCKGVEIYLFNFGINIHDAYNEGIDFYFLCFANWLTNLLIKEVRLFYSSLFYLVN